jgi:hypothetical protein
VRGIIVQRNEVKSVPMVGRLAPANTGGFDEGINIKFNDGARSWCHTRDGGEALRDDAGSDQQRKEICKE